jgi:hypothetical protein
VPRLATALVAAAALAPAAAPAHAAGLPPIRHVFVIVLENKGFGDSYGAGQVAAPYMTKTLPSMGVLVPRYYGIGHSSADNYLAMISGQPPTPASKNDCPDPVKQVGPDSVAPYGLAKSDGCLYPANFRTLGDQLTDQGLLWKGYQEEIPAPCSPLKNNPASGTHYARKHNPFVFFQSLILSGQCGANDVGLDQLTGDLANAGSTPNLAYITPNECSDGHTNCTTQNPDVSPIPGEVFIPSDTYSELQQEDGFLKKWVPRILASPAYKQDGLLAIVYDESDSDASACCNEQPGPADPNPGSVAGIPAGPGGGQTGAVLISPFISPGTTSTQEYNHYSLLRSIEDLFGASHLGYAGQNGLVPFGDDVYSGPRPPASSGGGGGSGSGGGTGGGSSSSSGPQPACGAPAPIPASSVTRLRHSRRRVLVSGHSESINCAGGVPVNVVQVAIARVLPRRRCRFLTVAGTVRPRARCSRPFWLLARGGGPGWRVRIRHSLARGRYLVRVRAIDARGTREPPGVRRFRIR